MFTNRFLCEKVALVQATILLFGMTSQSLATRYAPAMIYVDGKEVLFSGGSDQGFVDADEVWETLKTRQFGPGKEFSTVQIPSDVREFTLESDPESGNRNTIVLNVNWGGLYQTMSLRIIRVPPDRFGHEWMIDPVDVDRMYDRRLITRERAAYLKHPERIALADHAAAMRDQALQRENWLLPLATGVLIGAASATITSWLRRPKLHSMQEPRP